jgi:hypothetical protein
MEIYPQSLAGDFRVSKWPSKQPDLLVSVLPRLQAYLVPPEGCQQANQERA